MRRILPVLFCAAAVCLPLHAYAGEAAPEPAPAAKPAPSPTAALMADLAGEVQQALGDVSATGVFVATSAGDTRLERALQEAVVTALFEKGVPVLEAAAPGAPTVHLVAFATAAAVAEDRPNLLSRGFSVVRNVLIADPRVNLVTKPFSHDNKRPADATLLVTMSVARQGRLAARTTNAYTLPGTEALAQLALATP